MAKIKYNVKGVDGRATANLPKPGLYTAKVTSATVTKPDGKDQRIEVVYEIQDKEHKGFKLYDYVNLESEAARWKLKQFLDAMGVAKDSGTFDTDDFIGTGVTVKVKIQPETDQYAASAKPTTVLPLDGDENGEPEEDLSEDDEEDDEEDEDDTESDEDEEDEDEDDEEDEDEDDEAWTEDELMELEKDDLAEVAGEFEVAMPKKLTAAGKKKVVAAILEAQDEDDEEEEEDEDETPDYASMDLPDLKKLCKERELPTKGTKAILVKRLEKSDQPF